MTTETTTAAEIEFLRRWAADNGAGFEEEGECGFGRPCVGIVKCGEYPSYVTYESLSAEPYIRETHNCPEAAPPDEVTDAYHKHPCLAVLGRGDGAVHQLYLWVKHLEANGVVVEVRDRKGREIDRLFHGPRTAVLVKR